MTYTLTVNTDFKSWHYLNVYVYDTKGYLISLYRKDGLDENANEVSIPFTMIGNDPRVEFIRIEINNLCTYYKVLKLYANK